MDPKATWDLLVDAIISKDSEEARSIALSLLDWLERGGFPPEISRQRVTIEWQHLLCKRVCRSVISAPPEYWR